MGKLSDAESKVLKRLMAKQEAPDEPAASRALNISIDLGDEAQVARAQKLGLLSMFTDDDDDDDEGDDDKDKDKDKDKDTPPNRRGFFKE